MAKKLKLLSLQLETVETFPIINFRSFVCNHYHEAKRQAQKYQEKNVGNFIASFNTESNMTTDSGFVTTIS